VLNLLENEGKAGISSISGYRVDAFRSLRSAHFGLRSPINTRHITFLYSAATDSAVSLKSAWTRMHDERATFLLGPTVAWLALAN
jgi:hypothetical protein